MNPPPKAATGIPAVDRALEQHRQAIDDIMSTIAVDLRPMVVVLKDGITTRIKHGLGRPYRGVTLGPVSGAATSGRIEEVTSTSPSTDIMLRATGYGAEVSLGIVVF